MSTALKVGDRAPRFKARDVNGNPVSLKQYADSYTLVAFLRYAGCPWCNLAIHRLTIEKKLLKSSNCQVVAFVQSSKENIMKNIYGRHAQKPWFPIIADQTMQTYHQFGVKKSFLRAVSYHITQAPHWVHSVRNEGFKQATIDGTLFMAPALFLISPRDQIILQVDYSASLYEHKVFSKIYSTIAYHQAL